MVVYNVNIDPAAQASLQRIYNYLEKNASQEVAERVQNGILDTIESLATFPQRHKILPDILDEQIIYRRALKWRYKIIYTIEEAKLIVKVVEIIHSKQNQ